MMYWPWRSRTDSRRRVAASAHAAGVSAASLAGWPPGDRRQGTGTEAMHARRGGSPWPGTASQGLARGVGWRSTGPAYAAWCRQTSCQGRAWPAGMPWRSWPVHARPVMPFEGSRGNAGPVALREPHRPQPWSGCGRGRWGLLFRHKGLRCVPGAACCGVEASGDRERSPPPACGMESGRSSQAVSPMRSDE